MKKQALVVAGFCIAIGLAVTPAWAQAGGVQAKVPFSFSVAGKSFPAGDYTMIIGKRELDIQNAAGTKVAMVLANEISGRSSGATGQIIFHCYKDLCFLAEVWSPARDNGTHLLTSRSEADLVKEEKPKYFAVMGSKPKK